MSKVRNVSIYMDHLSNEPIYVFQCEQQDDETYDEFVENVVESIYNSIQIVVDEDS